MTKEEKELILKVCYASLLYGITVYVEHDTFYDEREPYKAKISIKSHQILDDFGNSPLSNKLLVRPYLRPMNEMTDEEKIEFRGFITWTFDCDYQTNTLKGVLNGNEIETDLIAELYDWLNAHHLDWRGLIPKGLALEAPKDMYNF